MRVVDCNGLGGAMVLGFIQQGFELQYRCGTLNLGSIMPESNRHITGWNWTSDFSKDFHDWDVIEDVDVVVATPPCSGFSTMTSKHLRGIDADVNKHMWAFADYTGKVAPKIAVMESVQQGYVMGKPLMHMLRNRVEELSGKKYHITHLFHNGLDAGGPAIRPRYFLVMSQIPFGVEVPEPDKVPTFKEVCGDLYGLHETWERQPYRAPDNWWSSRRRSPDGLVDGFIGRKMHAWKRISDILDATDGWWPQGMKQEDVMQALYKRDGKLPGVWEPALPRLLDAGFYMGPNQVVRWSEDRPCRVITGAALEVVLHPTEPRLITHREAARIQGFPDAWRLQPARNVKHLHRSFGKGVPVDAARWVGYWCKQAIEGTPGTMIGMPDGERARLLRADSSYKRALDRGGRRKHEFWADHATA